MNESSIQKAICIINAPRSLLHYIFLFLSDKEVKIGLKNEIDRWMILAQPDVIFNSRLLNMNCLMYIYPEFRNLFYYRIKKQASNKKKITFRLLLPLLRLFYKPMETLYIRCRNIGEGLFIQHGFSTIIAARKIGNNCWINQQVTIGYSNDTDCPTIGNNVTINAGAIIIGNVNVGDNSIVGANAVVVKDVPSNCTVVGVPAYIIRKDGVKVSR